MSVMQPPRKKHLYCLMSNRTKNQLGPFQSHNLEVAAFIRQTGDQYAIGHVVLTESSYMAADWQLHSIDPVELNIKDQFLNNEQRKILQWGKR